MAKGSKAKSAPVADDGVDKVLLNKIASGEVTTVDQAMAFAAGLKYQPQPDGSFNALIEVGGVDINTGRAPVRISEAGKAYLNGGAAVAASPEGTTETFELITNAIPPASKRGNTGGGAPVKYPFDKMELGSSFFVGVSTKLPNPVKTLGSTVSSANMRYATETGQTKQVERAKRDGKKAALDANGAKIMETKTVPIYKFERKFSIRPVKAGIVYGGWTAPADGALITRVAVE